MALTLKIDPAGRIVLPKPIRERHGLRAGSEIELTESGDGLLLKLVEQRASLVQEGRFLVHRGTPSADFDPRRAIDDDREDRIRHLAGSR
jgi:AbrB family looped-hinge helix DNA binding protein